MLIITHAGYGNEVRFVLWFSFYHSSCYYVSFVHHIRSGYKNTRTTRKFWSHDTQGAVWLSSYICKLKLIWVLHFDWHEHTLSIASCQLLNWIYGNNEQFQYLKVLKIRFKFNRVTLQYQSHNEPWVFKSSDGILRRKKKQTIKKLLLVASKCGHTHLLA